MSQRGGTARAAAARAGLRVEQGAHLPQAVDGALRKANLDARDRGLATEIAYGTERWRSFLDHALQVHLRQPLETLEPIVRTLLRQGAYQLLRLELPAYAVVSSETEAAGLSGAGRARGLINAVLRRVSESGPPPFPSDPIEALALRYAHPVWLVRRWARRLGEDGAQELLQENQETPPLVLRVNRRRATTQEVLRDLPATTEVPGLPWALALRSPGDVRALPGWRDGRFQVQDAGAQAVGESIGPAGRFLELACGRGTKTLQQAERQDGEVLGVDIDERRLEEAVRERERLGLAARFLQADALALPAQAGGQDEVLLDAPCSALGVVRRRPDAKWRRQEADLARNGEMQAALLRAALAACRQGGAVTYAVCSQEPEETVDPVQAVIAEGGVTALREPPSLAREELRVGYLLPGMYMARLLRG